MIFSPRYGSLLIGNYQLPLHIVSIKYIYYFIVFNTISLLSNNRDKDGQLNQDEFVIAMYLVSTVLSGSELPRTLPHALTVQRPAFDNLFGANSSSYNMNNTNNNTNNTNNNSNSSFMIANTNSSSNLSLGDSSGTNNPMLMMANSTPTAPLSSSSNSNVFAGFGEGGNI